MATLLHSGALFFFLLACVLYYLSPSALALGALAILFEIIAWVRWVAAANNLKGSSQD